MQHKIGRIAGIINSQCHYPTRSAYNKTYCYAELAISSLAVAVTIASTYYVYPWRDGQAELAWVAWLDTKTVYPRTVTHLSTRTGDRSRVYRLCTIVFSVLLGRLER